MSASWKRLVTADEISSFTSNTGTVTGITPGTGLKDGSDTSSEITTSGTLVLDLAELTDMTGAASATTEMVVVDNGDNGKRKALSEIGLDQFDNSTSGFTTNVGTVTSVAVSAGTNLNGGATITASGTATVNLDTGLTGMVSMAAVDQAAGTDDANGGDLTFKGGISTGTGAGGSIKFQVSAGPQAASANTQNALADALTIASSTTADGDSTVTIHGDLVVTGDSSSIEVQTLQVEDATVLLSDGATDAAGADGSGLKVHSTTTADNQPNFIWKDTNLGVAGWQFKDDGAPTTAGSAPMGVAALTKGTANPTSNLMPTGALFYNTGGTGTKGLYLYID